MTTAVLFADGFGSTAIVPVVLATAEATESAAEGASRTSVEMIDTVTDSVMTALWASTLREKLPRLDVPVVQARLSPTSLVKAEVHKQLARCWITRCCSPTPKDPSQDDFFVARDATKSRAARGDPRPQKS